MKRRGFLGAIGAALAAPLLPMRALAEIAPFSPDIAKANIGSLTVGSETIATNTITSAKIMADRIACSSISINKISPLSTYHRFIDNYDRSKSRLRIGDDGMSVEIVTEDGEVAERTEYHL